MCYNIGESWALASVSSAVTTLGTSYNWSYLWQNPAEGEQTIKVRATDSAGNVESPGPSVTVTVKAEKAEAPVEKVPVTPEKSITEMMVSELKAKMTEIQQQLINLLQRLIQLLQQQVQGLTGGGR